MKGQIANIYQDGKSTWIGMCTGNLDTRGYVEYLNLESYELIFVEIEYELGEILVDDIFKTTGDI